MFVSYERCARRIASAVLYALCKSEEKISVSLRPVDAKCWPRRLAWRKPWFVSGESLTPALHNINKSGILVRKVLLLDLSYVIHRLAMANKKQLHDTLAHQCCRYLDHNSMPSKQIDISKTLAMPTTQRVAHDLSRKLCRRLCASCGNLRAVRRPSLAVQDRTPRLLPPLNFTLRLLQFCIYLKHRI